MCRSHWVVRAIRGVEGGIVVISCDSLSTRKGYHLHFKQDSIKNLEKRAVIAAGEILERYGISRNRAFNSDTLESLDRTINDEVISEDARPD